MNAITNQEMIGSALSEMGKLMEVHGAVLSDDFKKQCRLGNVQILIQLSSLIHECRRVKDSLREFPNQTDIQLKFWDEVDDLEVSLIERHNKIHSELYPKD